MRINTHANVPFSAQSSSSPAAFASRSCARCMDRDPSSSSSSASSPVVATTALSSNSQPARRARRKPFTCCRSISGGRDEIVTCTCMCPSVRSAAASAAATVSSASTSNLSTRQQTVACMRVSHASTMELLFANGYTHRHARSDAQEAQRSKKDLGCAQDCRRLAHARERHTHVRGSRRAATPANRRTYDGEWRAFGIRVYLLCFCL